MKRETLKSLQNEWELLAKDNDMGVSWLVEDLEELLGDLTSDEMCTTTIEALLPLLEGKKLFAVDLLEGGKVRYWSGSTEQITSQIRKEWLELGRNPKLGEIVWFIGERSK
jgi:hypothetical protein